MITVRYIGPGSAILGGTYIYTGETRAATLAQLDAARQYHPEGFAIVGGEMPGEQMPIEQTLGSATPSPASVPSEAAPPTEVSEGGEELPVIAPAAIEPPEQEQPNEQQPGRAIQPAPERRGSYERRAHGKPIRPGR